MTVTRRVLIQAIAWAALAPFAGLAGAQAGTLKISHQFPGGTLTEGDFRDRLCRRFAADIYAKAGAKVHDLDDATVRKWQAIARDTAWKDYAERNETCASLLKAAQKLTA